MRMKTKKYRTRRKPRSLKSASASVSAPSTSLRKTQKRTFKGKDFSSGDGFVTAIWGPAAWHFLHTISFNYPVQPTAEDKRHYRDFVLQLRHILPCKYCRVNLTNNLKKKPLSARHMKNRATFSRYVYDLHELVNKMLGKKSGLSYCDVRERYEHFRSRCTEDIPRIFDLNSRPMSLKVVKNPAKHKRGTQKRTKSSPMPATPKEKGCTEPLYGKKSKCVINIVPQEDKTTTFHIDRKCMKTREPTELK